MPLCKTPTVGLTGGWDSRVVVSSLLASGMSFSARVKGQPELYDVVIASKLAKLGGFNLHIKSSAELPPDNYSQCRRNVSLALLWQAGYMVTEKHKTFLLNEKRLDGGRVNIMGQHGEIGRGYYTKKIEAEKLKEGQFEENLIKRLIDSKLRLIKKINQDQIFEIIREAYRQANMYGLEGFDRLDFFYLYERTRRWASAALSSQTGMVFAPFLCPGYIRASYAFRAQGGEFYQDGKMLNPFHRYIIERNTPEWVNVPYAEDLKREEKEWKKKKQCVSINKPNSTLGWKQSDGEKYYNLSLYWKDVGKPIIDDAIACGGFWTEVFDPDLIKKDWLSVADDIVMLHLLPEILQV